MEKLSNEEFEKLPKKLTSRSHPVRDWLMQMEVGESFRVPAKEWKWKSATPSHLCRAVEKQTSRRFECYKLLDGAGWAIRRTA